MHDILAQDIRYAHSVVHAESMPDGIFMMLNDGHGGTFRLEACALRDDTVRLRLSAAEFEPPAYDAVRSGFFTRPASCALSLSGDIVLRTPALTLRVTRNPFSLTVRDAAGGIVYEEQLLDVNAVGEGHRRVPPLGYTLDAQGGAACMNLCARLRPQERIFGLGERFGEMNRRGQSVYIWNQDTLGCRDDQAYKNIPFYISSAGYGLFLNTPLNAAFHVGSLSNASLSMQVPAQSAEAYLIVGAPLEVVAAFTNMTGPAICPPDWSFGLWYSTGFQGASARSVLEDAQTFRVRGVPCDVMHLDCYWMRDDHWCDFVWDDAAFPQRTEMLRALHDAHYRVCLWINPYVTCKTAMFREGAERGYFIKTLQGEPYQADLWHGLLSPCAVLDVTHPGAVAWFQEKLRTALREGVDTLKTDFGEDIPPDSVFADGRTGAQMRNLYATLYNQIVYAVLEEFGTPAVVWARSGSTGLQRTPVCWSGDSRSCFEGMAATLRGGLSLGVSGVPFWSHDIGGFYGAVSDDVFVRWAQFGLFTSHSRLHGTTDRKPWSFSPRACDAVEAAIRLRYRWMPYILRTAQACAREGLPFLRPLWLHNPEDPAVWAIQDQYWFGDDVMVAPVFGGDGAQRDVYLPAGRWTHFFTGESYSGQRWLRLASALEEFPLFVRENSQLGLLNVPAQWI